MASCLCQIMKLHNLSRVCNFFEEHLSTAAANYDNLAMFFEKIC